jgi:hypothetical protein
MHIRMCSATYPVALLLTLVCIHSARPCNEAQKPVVMFALVLLPSFVNKAMGL